MIEGDKKDARIVRRQHELLFLTPADARMFLLGKKNAPL
jgi:hypothetical protein